MTFAELILFCGFFAAIYRCLRPLQARLEGVLMKALSGKPGGGARKPPINVTDFKKRDL